MKTRLVPPIEPDGRGNKDIANPGPATFFLALLALFRSALFQHSSLKGLDASEQTICEVIMLGGSIHTCQFCFWKRKRVHRSVKNVFRRDDGMWHWTTAHHDEVISEAAPRDCDETFPDSFNTNEWNMIDIWRLWSMVLSLTVRYRGRAGKFDTYDVALFTYPATKWMCIV